MTVTLTLEIHDKDIQESVKSDLVRFAKRVQNALDKHWPLARMSSIEVTEINTEPHGSDVDG